MYGSPGVLIEFLHIFQDIWGMESGMFPTNIVWYIVLDLVVHKEEVEL